MRSALASSSPASLRISAARSAGGMRPQGPRIASRAASTARSMSRLPPKAVKAHAEPVDGLIEGTCSPSIGATHSPPMKSLSCMYA